MFDENGLLEPKEIVVEGKTFIISKFPAIEGREMLAGSCESYSYKDGSYPASEKLMLRMLAYAAIPSKTPGLAAQLLNNRAVINAHLTVLQLVKLQRELEKYNFDFLTDGSISNS